MTAKFDSEIVVIITGASSGIGQQAAKIFTQRGVTKFCLTSKFDLVETKKLCLSVNDKVEFVIVKGDITKPELREQIFNETIQKFERVDILVNNAGRGIVGNILDMTMEQYQEIFDVNVTATVHLSKLCLPYIRKVKGNIVTTSSNAAHKNMPQLGFYSMSKAALNMFTKALAQEEGPNGVRVNAVNPGATNTPFIASVGITPEELMQSAKTTHPIGRMADPEEIAKVLVFIASDDASYMTGSCVLCDGGLMCYNPI
ncbi:uncharacterized oxidoreductase TM_0325-like [Symsagittifera roscoffensis]|uniref:uncharacterized oxidoreductase TM_0325-like n=1 Tax=Symsagittifera roscoffensis TaxID=84072 RepID=UPI00307C3289